MLFGKLGKKDKFLQNDLFRLVPARNPTEFSVLTGLSAVISALGAFAETIRLMKEIDEVIEVHGGWPGLENTRSRRVLAFNRTCIAVIEIALQHASDLGEVALSDPVVRCD